MKKRLIKMPAKALEDADVAFISLVKSPANMIPYKILKAIEDPNNQEKPESPMFTFSLLGKRKGEALAPSIAAIIVSKANLGQFEAKFKELGFVTDDISEQEGMVILKQETFDPELVVIHQLNEDIAVAIANARKAFDSFPETTDFNEKITSFGFIPGIHIATDALMDTIRDVMFSAEDQAGAASMTKAAIDSYSQFVIDLVDSLPAVAFKMEEMRAVKSEDGEPVAAPAAAPETTEVVAAVTHEIEDTNVVTDETSAGEVTADNVVDINANAGEEEEVPVDEEEEVPVAAVAMKHEAVPGDHDGLDEEVVAAKEEIPAAVAAPTEEVDTTAESAKKDDETIPAWVGALKTELLGGITAVSEKVDKLKGEVDGLGERVEKSEAIAKSANEAVRGTVPAGSDYEDDTLATATSRKSTAQKGMTGSDEFWGGALSEIPTAQQG